MGSPRPRTAAGRSYWPESPLAGIDHSQADRCGRHPKSLSSCRFALGRRSESPPTHHPQFHIHLGVAGP